MVPSISHESRILIAGASVRAAVQSAQRSGWGRLIAADLFQDRDLGSAERCPLTDGYDKLPSEAVRLGADAWMYCGALENRPDVIEKVPVPLLGCEAPVLRAIRDPWQVAAALAEANLPAIDLARSDAPLPRDGTWLRKPIASAAGRHIAVVGDERLPEADEPIFFQRRIEGIPTSGVFVAAEGRCRLLGSSRQLIGLKNPGDGGFHYLGSMGPESLDARQRMQWEQIGEALTARFALRGLFGVDAIMTSEQILPVEVNPRFTASVEVLERAYGWSAWSLHQQACCNGRLPVGTPRTATLTAAKRIVFAACDLCVDDAFLDWAEAQNRGRAWPALADLPAKPGRLACGMPVLTVLVGPSPLDSWSALWGELDERFAQVCEVLMRRAIPEDSPPTLT